MYKTDTFFVIHNFNTIPINLLEYCHDYIVYDASSNAMVEDELKKLEINYIKIPNTGHNITTYFRYFADNYEKIPDTVCLLKGNIIGRHCSKEFFERVYQNKYFTYLYEDKHVKLTKGINFLAMENQYLEYNNSWYVKSTDHPHDYFDNFNNLLQFIYKNPCIPEYCTFSPGACYIVTKEQVLKHSREFYLNLNKIMDYGLRPSFPSEAHQIERMLPIIFQANYETNSWMNDLNAFDQKLYEKKIILQENEEKGRTRWRKKKRD